VLNVAYRNLSTACASCHQDVHLGQEGDRCENCHSLAQPKFAASGFAHAKTSFPLTGKHAAAACSVCHKPETAAFPARRGTAIRYKGLGHECRACHEDVHLGQVPAACEACHTTQAFRIDRYRHQNARLLAASFFVGAHAVATCQACHKPSTGQFPAGRGRAVRFKVETACESCHADVHRGALGPDCARCHRP
jgi:5-methylcytosine-specific restriction endonuclease McrA